MAAQGGASGGDSGYDLSAAPGSGAGSGAGKGGEHASEVGVDCEGREREACPAVGGNGELQLHGEL